jgi:hypothetical protein
MRKTSAYARKRRAIAAQNHYNALDATDKQMDDGLRVAMLTRMWEGLAAIESNQSPTIDDWRVCADAVNLMETLLLRGPWLAADGNMVEVTDPNGLLVDATEALRLCAMRYQSGKPLRLDGKGILSLRGLLEDYAQAVSVLSERAVARCFRLTERRISVIRNGETRPHDVVLVSPC